MKPRVIQCAVLKFDLVHQTVSPRERVGSGDETKTVCTKCADCDISCFLVCQIRGFTQTTKSTVQDTNPSTQKVY